MENSGYIGVDKRFAKAGAYGLRKHRQERSSGNFLAPTAATPAFANEYSVDFDKSNDYCGVGSDPILSVYAMSVWFKPSTTISVGYHGTLVGGWSSGYGGIRLGMSWVVEFVDYNYTISAGDLAPLDTSWHHCIVNYVATGYETVSDPPVASQNGKGYEIWVDGTRVDTALGSTSYNYALGTTTAKFKLGREGERALYYYGGLIDELSIFGSSLSSVDIAAIYNSGTPTDLTDYSPTLWWRMGDNDGGSGTTITDQGSGGNDGALTNGPTFSTETP